MASVAVCGMLCNPHCPLDREMSTSYISRASEKLEWQLPDSD
jgi:hypothetical protein